MRGAASRQPVSPDRAGAPYRYLALRVIDQAFRDLASPGGSREDQESARVFLSGSEIFRHWCEVADVDPAWMVARAKKHMARPAP